MSDASELITADTVSVIIPVLNNADTIAEAIGSVLAQSTPPGEVVVMDDGSSDESGEIAAACGGMVRVIRQQTGGIAAARNAGIRAATGHAIALLDADDRWLPDALEREVAALGTDVDLAYGWVAQVHESAWQATIEAGAPRATWMPGPSASAIMIRRSAFDRVGFFHDYRAGEFIDWFARAREAGLRISQLDGLVTLRRIHTQNHGIRQAQIYAQSYLAVARAALERTGALGTRQPDLDTERVTGGKLL